MPIGRTVEREQKTSSTSDHGLLGRRKKSSRTNLKVAVRCQVEPDTNQNSARGRRWTMDRGSHGRRSQQEQRGSSALGRRNELPLTGAAQCNQDGKQDAAERKAFAGSKIPRKIEALADACTCLLSCDCDPSLPIQLVPVPICCSQPYFFTSIPSSTEVLLLW